jgi:preprotein translocase subunit SecE
VAKRGSKKRKSSVFQPVTDYLRETRAELRKVHWPTRDEAKNLTGIVLAVTLAMAALLGTLDWLFDVELRGLIVGNIVALVVLGLAVVSIVSVAIVLNRRNA